MRSKSCAKPSTVPWEGLLHGTRKTYGEGRKRINLRFLRPEEGFGLSGILWRLFLTQNCKSPLLLLYDIKSCMGQVRLAGMLVSICSRPPTWVVGLCTGATLTFSISNVIAQCWSTRKQLLRWPLGNQSTCKETRGLCCAYVSDGWKYWVYDKDCSREWLILLFYLMNGQCERSEPAANHGDTYVHAVCTAKVPAATLLPPSELLLSRNSLVALL